MGVRGIFAVVLECGRCGGRGRSPTARERGRFHGEAVEAGAFGAGGFALRALRSRRRQKEEVRGQNHILYFLLLSLFGSGTSPSPSKVGDFAGIIIV